MSRDNYAIQVENAKGLFLGYDQEALIEKFRLRADEDYLYLPFLDMDYRIHRRTAAVEKREGDGPWTDGNSFNEVLTIFDALCWSKADRRLSGQWVSLSALGGGVHGGSATGGFFRPLVERIARREQLLEGALRRMGGVPMPKGEPGYQLPAFSFLPVYLQYWRADEDFPAQLHLFWDANTTDFIHYETAYYLGNFLLTRILEWMGRENEPNNNRNFL